MSTLGKYELKNTNKSIVEAIEKNASNSIKLTLDGVFDFMNRHKNEYHPTYKVFNEQFVLCWAGKKKIVEEKTFYSRVDIELINDPGKEGGHKGHGNWVEVKKPRSDQCISFHA